MGRCKRIRATARVMMMIPVWAILTTACKPQSDHQAFARKELATISDEAKARLAHTITSQFRGAAGYVLPTANKWSRDLIVDLRGPIDFEKSLSTSDFLQENKIVLQPAADADPKLKELRDDIEGMAALVDVHVRFQNGMSKDANVSIVLDTSGNRAATHSDPYEFSNAGSRKVEEILRDDPGRVRLMGRVDIASPRPGCQVALASVDSNIEFGSMLVKVGPDSATTSDGFGSEACARELFGLATTESPDVSLDSVLSIVYDPQITPGMPEDQVRSALDNLAASTK